MQSQEQSGSTTNSVRETMDTRGMDAKNRQRVNLDGVRKASLRLREEAEARSRQNHPSSSSSARPENSNNNNNNSNANVLNVMSMYNQRKFSELQQRVSQGDSTPSQKGYVSPRRQFGPSARTQSQLANQMGYPQRRNQTQSQRGHVRNIDSPITPVVQRAMVERFCGTDRRSGALIFQPMGVPTPEFSTLSGSPSSPQHFTQNRGTPPQSNNKQSPPQNFTQNRGTPPQSNNKQSPPQNFTQNRGTPPQSNNKQSPNFAIQQQQSQQQTSRNGDTRMRVSPSQGNPSGPSPLQRPSSVMTPVPSDRNSVRKTIPPPPVTAKRISLRTTAPPSIDLGFSDLTEWAKEGVDSPYGSGGRPSPSTHSLENSIFGDLHPSNKATEADRKNKPTAEQTLRASLGLHVATTKAGGVSMMRVPSMKSPQGEGPTSPRRNSRTEKTSPTNRDNLEIIPYGECQSGRGPIGRKSSGPYPICAGDSPLTTPMLGILDGHTPLLEQADSGNGSFQQTSPTKIIELVRSNRSQHLTTYYEECWDARDGVQRSPGMWHSVQEKKITATDKRDEELLLSDKIMESRNTADDYCLDEGKFWLFTQDIDRNQITDEGDIENYGTSWSDTCRLIITFTELDREFKHLATCLAASEPIGFQKLQNIQTIDVPDNSFVQATIQKDMKDAYNDALVLCDLIRPLMLDLVETANRALGNERSPDWNTRQSHGPYDGNLCRVDRVDTYHECGEDKSMERTISKAISKYDGNIGRVQDIIRNRIVCSSYWHMAHVIEIFFKLVPNSGHRVVKYVNGFKFCRMCIEIRTGPKIQVCEIQFHHQDVHVYKTELEQKLYFRFRDYFDKATPEVDSVMRWQFLQGLSENILYDVPNSDVSMSSTGSSKSRKSKQSRKSAGTASDSTAASSGRGITSYFSNNNSTGSNSVGTSTPSSNRTIALGGTGGGSNAVRYGAYFGAIQGYSPMDQNATLRVLKLHGLPYNLSNMNADRINDSLLTIAHSLVQLTEEQIHLIAKKVRRIFRFTKDIPASIRREELRELICLQDLLSSLGCRHIAYLAAEFRMMKNMAGIDAEAHEVKKRRQSGIFKRCMMSMLECRMQAARQLLSNFDLALAEEYIINSINNACENDTKAFYLSDKEYMSPITKQPLDPTDRERKRCFAQQAYDTILECTVWLEVMGEYDRMEKLWLLLLDTVAVGDPDLIHKIALRLAQAYYRNEMEDKLQNIILLHKLSPTAVRDPQELQYMFTGKSKILVTERECRRAEHLEKRVLATAAVCNKRKSKKNGRSSIFACMIPK